MVYCLMFTLRSKASAMRRCDRRALQTVFDRLRRSQEDWIGPATDECDKTSRFVNTPQAAPPAVFSRTKTDARLRAVCWRVGHDPDSAGHQESPSDA